MNRVLEAAWAGSVFYARKWRAAGLPAAPLASLDDLARLPFVTRAEFVADQAAVPPLGTKVTCPPSALVRFHRSSGTTQAPLLWADSAESWRWVTRGSASLWRLAGVGGADRLLLLLNFGAASGPCIIHAGACRLGCACWPLGTVETEGQLCGLTAFKPTVLAGTPAGLGALAERIRAEGRPPRHSGVNKLILCGPHEARQRTALQQIWGAECFDRYGLTEAGSVAAECEAHPGGLHVLDDRFIVESIHPTTGAPVPDGEPGELVLTTLGRLPCPIIRYRTGDRVRLVRNHACACGRRGSL
ncbi:MAG TPA: AMP-binding protein, partial [Methylomirabilota bacterium]|nr:AMP-binding protein [Methylomirabilota bacterium]